MTVESRNAGTDAPAGTAQRAAERFRRAADRRLLTSEYILTCDSTVDISPAHLKELGVSFIKFHFTVDGKEYLDDLGETLTFDEFYKLQAGGADIRTSQANRIDYTDFFEPFLKEGKDILHISFSSGLSGSFNSATFAAQDVMERYPERKVFVVDSRAASGGYGLLVDTVARKKAEGLEIEALCDWTEENRLRLQHWFFSSDLSFYIKGGRISKAAGTVASALGICPLMHMDEPGHLVPVDKLHTKKKTMKNIVKMMEERAEGGTEYNQKCYITHSACPEDAGEIAAAIKAKFPHIEGDVLINSIGTSVGSHTGPGTVALFFWGSDRSAEQA